MLKDGVIRGTTLIEAQRLRSAVATGCLQTITCEDASWSRRTPPANLIRSIPSFYHLTSVI